MTDDSPIGPGQEPVPEPPAGGEPTAAPPSTTGPTPAPRRVSAADLSGRIPEYKGDALDAARGPGLGCFWLQVIVLGVFIVLIPIGLELNWPFELLAVLLFVVIGLLLFVGQTLVFLLRLVAAERGQGRHRPLAGGTKTVGELEDEQRAQAVTAAEGGAAAAGELGLDVADRLLVDAALAQAAGALRQHATFAPFALVLEAGAEVARPVGQPTAASLEMLIAGAREKLARVHPGRAAICRDARLAGPGGPIDAIVVNVEAPGREPRGAAVPYRRHGETVELLDARSVPGERLLLAVPPPAPDRVRE